VWQPVRRLLGPKWLARHALALVLFTGCLALGWWQLDRASSGNTLSWAYTAEWPLFALFVLWVWFRWARDDVKSARGEDPYARVRPEPMRMPARQVVPSVAADEDPETAAYNRLLAWLAAHPDRRPGDYRDIPG
jgi:DNA-binding transcriptional regulator of glucitol operon